MVRCNGQLSQNQKDEFLAKHNEDRSTVSPDAANMRRMEWNTQIEAKAQSYVNQLAAANSGLTHSTSSYRTYDDGVHNGYHGENLARGYSSVSSVMYAWVENERNLVSQDYLGYGQGNGGHMTQVLWDNSWQLGCAKAGSYWICQYGPGGNYVGQDAYDQGTPCSQCPAGYTQCVDKLCTLDSAPTTYPTPTPTLVPTSAPTTPPLIALEVDGRVEDTDLSCADPNVSGIEGDLSSAITSYLTSTYPSFTFTLTTASLSACNPVVITYSLQLSSAFSPYEADLITALTDNIASTLGTSYVNTYGVPDVTTAETVTESSGDEGSEEENSGMIAGATIGAVIAVAVIVTLAYFCFRYKVWDNTKRIMGLSNVSATSRQGTVSPASNKAANFQQVQSVSPVARSPTAEIIMGHVDAKSTPKGTLPKGWSKHFTDEGLPYYFNSSTGESSWDNPAARI
eukprot:CAMPEP_0184495008 /NCGR_PEP_ID=MMETSP0113_2-20130426/30144_1 /TAXON_ID=91329 /ORGANISM="Norrisiella sphaerica, Strain BC52" /LENGTH=453 /DNA_ID=CAMNT_0026881005 /DNA_START=284 /DNA_END=1645 /DNA_ORIENTATION=-